MKTIASAVLLLFVFSTVSANAANEPVLDFDGEALLPGVEYYVVALFPLRGHALDWSEPNRCPKVVIQREVAGDYGNPVKFFPVDTNASVVRVSTDLNIQFVPGIDPWCRASTSWRVDNYDPSTGKWWITTGGRPGEPGANTLTNWFKIERVGVSGQIYRLTFCPSVCDSCVTLCSEISSYSYGGQTRLALSHSGWLFAFMKASKAKEQVALKL